MDTIALVGNPNSGKTTLFNVLTGTNQHVGNWPGVTVEKKAGKTKYKDKEYAVVDLPGAYGLGGYSEDEAITRDFVLEGKHDIVINVVDATNLERNLYLTTLLLEMGTKLVIALNMADEAENQNIKIDLARLSQELGVKVIPTVASRGRGIDDLMKATEETINQEIHRNSISYGEDIDGKLCYIENRIEQRVNSSKYPPKWLALKLLENDKQIIDRFLEDNEDGQDLLKEIKSAGEEVVAASGMEPELAILDKRYEFVSRALENSVSKPKENGETLSDKIDKIVTHKFLGIPIFALVMFLIYQLTFTLGQDVLGEMAAEGMASLGLWIGKWLETINAPGILTLFVTDGVFGGVGAVLEFIPIIIVMYLLFGLLEDSGYLARAAYIMDRSMRALGLHGKTFISMLIGTGCNVPGIMATRTMENKKDRMIAILINPFMSCGARLPIYMVFIAAFFPKHGGLVLFSLYGLGIAIALIMGKIFSKTLFKGEETFL